MSRISKAAAVSRAEETMKRKKPVVNYMGGISYQYNPLDTLKMVSASSIFAEPQYYRKSGTPGAAREARCLVDTVFKPYSIIPEAYLNKTATEIMEDVIDKALSYDFSGTLAWAKELRTDYNMRLNPQVIMVRAAMHEGRQAFTEEHKGLFSQYMQDVMFRADEPGAQMNYYVAVKGSVRNLPSILKRAWAKKLSEASGYALNKYKNTGSIIDVVRVCHAKSTAINELMRTGAVKVDETKQTWETMRSAGRSWREILNTIKIGHMALLRNLRGIFSEIDDAEFCRQTMEYLKNGVPDGKQFPFRYYSAYRMVKGSGGVHHQAMILDALEDCIDIACGNLPKLGGRTMCLSDNSGSAHGTFTSEYGSVCVSDIDNLSSVITARNSDEGYVGVFGDRLNVSPVSKRNGVLTQTGVLNTDVGQSTENGVWLFFEKAIRCHEHWDNVFIYSDMQAGHAGLYGLGSGDAYKDFRVQKKGLHFPYIDVARLVEEYRKQVNPKVNVFCVQTAGYDNSVLPENGHRTCLLKGWTGKEALYAAKMIDIWNGVESRADSGQTQNTAVRADA